MTEGGFCGVSGFDHVMHIPSNVLLMTSLTYIVLLMEIFYLLIYFNASTQNRAQWFIFTFCDITQSSTHTVYKAEKKMIHGF